MSYSPSVAGGIQSTLNSSTANVGGSDTLSSQIETDTSLIPLTSVAEFPASGTVKIGSEYITYTSVAGLDLVVGLRGAFATTAAQHLTSATVSGAYVGTAHRTSHPDVIVSLVSDQAGTEYFDFSTDNVNWAPFPVAGFTVAASIHEFHSAVKAYRYFRVRFDNTSGTLTTDFRVYTVFGVFRQGSAPLNQSISLDTDAVVVCAVSTGQLPDDTFSQLRMDGTVFQTTTNLGGTTMNHGATLEVDGTQVTLTDSSGFPSSGTIQIESEQMTYTGNAANVLTGLGRGVNGTSAATHVDLTVVGEVYYSGVYSTSGYTQIQTSILASHDGTIAFDFQSDAAGTDTVRNLPIPYASAGGYQLFSAPIFGPYTTGRFVNTSGSNQTDFFFTTSLLTKSISGQVLAANAFIAPTMVANLGRNIAVGRQPDGDFVNAPADGNAFEYTNAAFAADASYASGWCDSDGFNMFEVFLESDQLSAANGVVVNYTNDTSADTPIVHASRTFSFSQYDVDEGFKLINLQTMLDGFQIQYTNGAAQADLYIAATLKTNGATANFDKAGATQVSDFSTSAALGSASNYETGTINGRNGNTASGGEDVTESGGLYAGFPTSTTPVTIQVSSSSTDDVNTTGTGAWTVLVRGLATSTASEYTTETFNLNGTTAVPGGTWWRVISARVVTVGSGTINAGLITIEQSGGPVYCTIQIAENASSAAVYTVPTGHKLLLKHIVAVQARTNGATGSGVVTLRSRPSTTANSAFHPLKRFSVQTGMELDVLYQGGIVVDELTDLKMRCDGVSGTSDVCCDIEYLLIRK